MKLNIAGDGHRTVFKQLERQGDKILMTLPYENRFGHRMFQTANNQRYYVIFKKEMYKTFGNEFGTNEGYGESINQEFLDIALKRHCHMILYVYDNSSIYAISPKLMAMKGKVRLQNNNKETTVSVPMKYLVRWDV